MLRNSLITILCLALGVGIKSKRAQSMKQDNWQRRLENPRRWESRDRSIADARSYFFVDDPFCQRQVFSGAAPHEFVERDLGQNPKLRSVSVSKEQPRKSLNG